MHHYETQQGEFRISTNKQLLQVDVIYQYLSVESYWAKDVPRYIVDQSIANSLCFGLYHDAEQIGFARVITDLSTFAYLADVFVLTPFRGQGLSKWMMETILAHPDLQTIRRFMLATQDAHGLYAQYGFKPLENPERIMAKPFYRNYAEFNAARESASKR